MELRNHGWVSELSMLTGIKCVFYTSEYITEESDAVIPHVRICVGAAQ